MSHPNEIRELAINHVEDGGLILDALEKYKVSRSSFQRWVRLKKETGSSAIPARNTQPYKVDNSKLKEYIKENPSAYIKEISDHFNLSTGCISTALKRLKISSKKKVCYTQNATKNNETNLNVKFQK